MARPRKESLDYFPHDTDASNDEKVYALRSMFGNDGYAFFFILLERIYRTSIAELDVSKPVLMASVVKQVGVDAEKFDEILEASFDVNLFDRQEYELRKVITSHPIKRRFGEVQSLREKWRGKKDKNNDLPSEFSKEKTEQETTGKTPQRKEKESKEKEIKKEYADYVFLSEIEHEKLRELLGEELESYFLRFGAWISEKPSSVQKSRSAYLTILNWHRDKPARGSSTIGKTGRAAKMPNYSLYQDDQNYPPLSEVL